MARLVPQLNLRVVLYFIDETRRRLIAFESLRRKDDLVDVGLFIHLKEALVVDGEQVDRGWKVQDQAENLAATVQLLN